MPPSTSLTTAQRAKFQLLATGLSISEEAHAYIRDRNDNRPMTPADYASTSGVILALPDDVWVNAPIAQHNASFVTDPTATLVVSDDGLVVRVPGGDLPTGMWLPPLYHGQTNEAGEPYNSFAFTHGDRVRIAPIEGCSMTCKFCNLPYEFRYRTKRVAGLVDAVRVALDDPFQPASHVLISGGTPRDADIGYVRDVYESVAASFPGLPVDVMMVPIDHLMDVRWLAAIGVSEVSVNIEVFNREIAHTLMRKKANQGLDHYLDYLEDAVTVLGGERVRSMLMVGLESMEDTLRGVDAIATRGATPVLSPFRPDEATPLRGIRPPDAEFLEEVFLRSTDVAATHGVDLGPSCVPCSHNTLTLAQTPAGVGSAHTHHGNPLTI